MRAYEYYHKHVSGYPSAPKNGVGYVRSAWWVRWRRPSGAHIYLIRDNLSSHTAPAAVAAARKLRSMFVPAPTNASRLNPIETHLRTIRRCAFTGSN
jgi:hypothetical protein